MNPLPHRILVCCALLAPLPPLRAEQIIFSEIMYHPSGTLPEYLEIENLTATPFDIADWRFSDGIDYTFPSFNAGDAQASFLKPFERILVSPVDEAELRAAYAIPANVRVFGSYTGALANDGERITLQDKNGVTRSTVNYSDGRKWPTAADGAGHSLAVVDKDRLNDDYRNWSASKSRGGTPGTAEITEAEESYPNPEVNLAVGIPFVNYADAWDFNDQNLDLGTTWKDPSYAYTHAGWTLVGAAGNVGGHYGFETSAIPAPGIRTPTLNSTDAANHITYYFRKTFTYNGSLAGVTVSVDMVNDDGALFYLNGSPIGGVGVPAGANWKTLANRTVGEAVEEVGVASGTGAQLVLGTNVLAAEVHQVNNTSSDLVFGARLSISVPNTPSIVINEVLPAGAGTGFVEFFNPTGTAIDLGGYYLSDTPGNLTKFRIPGSLGVAPSGIASVGYTESNLAIATPTVVYLTAPDGTTAVTAISTSLPLDGRSLGRKPDGGGNWFLFVDPTRDAANASASAGSLAGILTLSELAFVPGTGDADFVELHHRGAGALSLDGLAVASALDFSDRVALAGSIAGGGYASIEVPFVAVGGSLPLFLIDAGDNVIASTVIRRPTAGREAAQAWPAGSTEWFSTVTGSRNAANDPDRTEDIVLNEVMYDTLSGHRNGEYLELFNRGADAVDLSGWEIVDGVAFTFPAGTSIPAGGFLVVAADSAWMTSTYGGIPVVGNFDGQLAGGGELVRLEDAWGNLADEVHYLPGGDWPEFADGDGSSMELRHPDMDNGISTAWADSDESTKSTMGHYSVSGQYLQINSIGTPDDYRELHLHLVGDAYVILENIMVRKNGAGTNFVTNGTTHATNGSSASGWLCQGTHWASFVQAGQLHLICDGHGDNKANRAEIDITGILPNDNLTIEFDARWVRGRPRLIAQTWDHTVGKPFLLEVPNILGTPGAPNSALIASAAPAVSDLTHSPAVPTAADSVTVTARIASASPPAAVELIHRLDNLNGDGDWLRAPMSDDGATGGDETAGDGVYTATLTQYRSDDAVVQFYVEATGAGATVTRQPRFSPSRPALYVVDNNNIPMDLGTQRFVISQYDRDALTTNGHTSKYQFDFPRMSNHYFNATFVSNERKIFYNAELRKSGSPFTRNLASTLDHGKWKLPGDRYFRDQRKRVIDPSGSDAGMRHNDRIARYFLYLLGHPTNENEFVRVIINGDGATLREDMEPIANDFLARNFENGTDGTLLRIDDEWFFEDFNPDGTAPRTSRNADWSYKGTESPVRYHSEWLTRSRETAYDYSSFIEFVKSVNQGGSEADLNRLMDHELCALNAAVRGYDGDWDTLTLNRGKNGYFYRKPDGLWMLLHWDGDRTFENSGETVLGSLPGVQTYFNKPYVRRFLNYYLTELIDRYTMNSPRTAAWMQAEENASNSYPMDTTKFNNWFSARRTSANITNLISAAQSTTFAITSGGGTTSADFRTLVGTSPSNVLTLRVVGRPDAVVAWTSTTGWSISNLWLANGVNNFTVEGLDREGNVVRSDSVSVTKTNNGPPVVALATDPASLQLGVAETLHLDAGGSLDPEGGALAFEWSVSPAENVSLAGNGSTATATFARPGLYEFTVTATDAQNLATSVTREVAVYHAADFSSFTDLTLPAHYQTANLERRDNYSPSAWFSLEDTPGNLRLQVTDAGALPLTFASPGFPTLSRDLPDEGDFSLQTNFELVARQFGDFQSGLTVDTLESGLVQRYYFGLQNGNVLVVKQFSSGGTSTPATLAWTLKRAKLRVLRAGNSLRFDYRVNDVWTNLFTRPLAAGTTAGNGGLFTATGSPQSVGTDFDFLLLVDPNQTSPALDFLRVTEVMYHPAPGEALEFVELLNTGPVALDLSQVLFEDGQPFDFPAFGPLMLDPGEYGVLVADITAFTTEYGSAPRVLARWIGGVLANTGERVVLRDPLGNAIHDFTYDDEAPWPIAADGLGPSLEVIDTEGDYNDPANWTAASVRGTPGGPPVSDPDRDGDGLGDSEESALGTNPDKADSDGDGAPDGAEVAAGTDPLDPASVFAIAAIVRDPGSGEVTLSWSSVPGKNYKLQASVDLGADNWIDLNGGAVIPSQGAITGTTIPAPAPGDPHRYCRAVVAP